MISKLTHAEWQHRCDEENDKLTRLLDERLVKLQEIARLDNAVRGLSQEIIRQERFIANLQWAQPKPPRGYKTKPHKVEVDDEQSTG